MIFYTIKDVAKMLQVHSETIRRYVLSGKLEAFKAGGEWRITDQHIKNFIEKNTNRKGE